MYKTIQTSPLSCCVFKIYSINVVYVLLVSGKLLIEWNDGMRIMLSAELVGDSPIYLCVTNRIGQVIRFASCSEIHPSINIHKELLAKRPLFGLCSVKTMETQSPQNEFVSPYQCIVTFHFFFFAAINGN